MTNAIRCPGCFIQPDVAFEGDKVILECKRHGHIAQGDSLEMAVVNWNQYISFVRAVA